MSDEEWVKVATGDDAMVAKLLLMFKQVNPTKESVPAPQPPKTSKQALSVEWKVRQRRSRAVMVQSKKQAPRASPTTPLSWSGATSVSGGGGGGGGGGSGSGAFDGSPEEESSRLSPIPPPPHPPKRSDSPRSKVIGTGETTSTSTKRTRRKKTLAELKEEEDLLQKERRQLKRELATLHLNLEKARATNEKLKKMKLEFQSPPAAESASAVSSTLANSDQLQQKASDDSIPAISTPIAAGSLQCSPPNGSSEVEEEVTADKFVLPDLNLPFEETSNPDILCGVS